MRRDRVEDPEGRIVELTDEGWQHIAAAHPELAALRELILETVRRPTLRLSGRRPNEAWFLTEEAGPSRWLHVVVAYEGDRGWIVTRVCPPV